MARPVRKSATRKHIWERWRSTPAIVCIKVISLRQQERGKRSLTSLIFIVLFITIYPREGPMSLRSLSRKKGVREEKELFVLGRRHLVYNNLRCIFFQQITMFHKFISNIKLTALLKYLYQAIFKNIILIF